MQYVNAPALRMFGYRKGELEGKNISMLMPAPFSQQHDSECHGARSELMWTPTTSWPAGN